MVTIPPAKRPNQRRKVRPAAVQTVAPLVLVAANFDPDGPITYLTFDRAVDVSAAVASQFALADGPDNGQFVGVSAGAGGLRPAGNARVISGPGRKSMAWRSMSAAASQPAW